MFLRGKPVLAEGEGLGPFCLGAESPPRPSTCTPLTCLREKVVRVRRPRLPLYFCPAAPWSPPLSRESPFSPRDLLSWRRPPQPQLRNPGRTPAEAGSPGGPRGPVGFILGDARPLDSRMFFVAGACSPSIEAVDGLDPCRPGPLGQVLDYVPSLSSSGRLFNQGPFWPL